MRFLKLAMKRMLICLMLTLVTGRIARAAAEKPYLISGFDDVLRQAENTGLLRAALKIFDEDQTFTGMPELYQVISQDSTPPAFVIVSAISSAFESRIEKFLNQSHFPSRHLYLRNWLTEWSIENFKIERIQQILNHNPGRKFIIIFDNSDPSLALAESLRSRFPEKILNVYLRQVVDKKIPADATAFYTAFDIALAEYRAARLDEAGVNRVAEAILNEKQIDRLFPKYALCPKTYEPCSAVTGSILVTCNKVKHFVRDLCGAG